MTISQKSSIKLIDQSHLRSTPAASQKIIPNQNIFLLKHPFRNQSFTNPTLIMQITEVRNTTAMPH